MNITKERYEDLLIGALYELKEIASDFESVCETIGITEDELKYLDFTY